MFNKSFYIVLAGAVMAVSGANAAGTQVQTVQSTDRAYENVETRLSTVTTQVDGIIDTTGTQKTEITGLLNNKQNRPNEDCEAGKNCLLVKDAGGTEHWYPIIDCGEVPFFGNMGQHVLPGHHPTNGSSGKMCYQDYDSHVTSMPECLAGEWGHLYYNGMVYGEAKPVAIAETAPGTVVTLGDNVPVGDTCVCRVKAYAPLTSGSFSGSNAVYSNRTSFTTDKWVVVGKVSENLSGTVADNLSGYVNSVNVNSCIDVCAFTDSSDELKASYYTSISNTCSGSVPQATACQFNSFFTYLVAKGQYGDQGSVEMRDGAPYGWGACGGSFANNSHCAVNQSNVGSWIVDFENLTTEGNIGYVYGIGGFVSLPSGAQIKDLIDVSASSVHRTPQSGDNAAVCMISGYKVNGASSETPVNINKAIVYSVDIGNWDDAATACAEWMGFPRGGDEASILYNALANYCPGN
jgi:hypothetical protein